MSFWRKVKFIFSGPEPRPFHTPAKEYNKAETLAEQIDSLCAMLNCTVERDLAGEQIRLSFVFKNGDRLSGQGPSTREAFAALHQRVKRIYDL